MTNVLFQTIHQAVQAIAIGVGMSVAITGAGHAALNCADLGTVLRSAEGNYLDASGAMHSPSVLKGADFCTMAQDLSGANAFHCGWGHDYRTGAATKDFEDKTASLQQCFDQAAAIGTDKAVNHPDFYDQRQFQIDDVIVTISLKDKATLQQTYVFLAVHGVANN